MHTNFGERDLFGSGDTATFKNDQISLSDHGLYIVHGHQKIQSIGIGSKKFMQVGIDATCLYTNFGGHGLSGLGDFSFYVCLQKWPKFPLDHRIGSKISLQVEINVKCMRPTFCGIYPAKCWVWHCCF